MYLAVILPIWFARTSKLSSIMFLVTLDFALHCDGLIGLYSLATLHINVFFSAMNCLLKELYTLR